MNKEIQKLYNPEPLNIETGKRVAVKPRNIYQLRPPIIKSKHMKAYWSAYRKELKRATKE
jgi:hypothetical protein